jgi:hypothetical protein
MNQIMVIVKMNRVIKHPRSHGISAVFYTTQELLNIDFVRYWKENFPWKERFKGFSYGPDSWGWDCLLFASYEKYKPKLIPIAYLELERGFKLDIPYIAK